MMASRLRDRRLPPPRPSTAAPLAGAAPYPVRRRPKLVLLGLALVVLFGWAGATIYLAAGDREEVVAVARGVPAYAPLARGDLTTTRVAADPGVELVAAERVDELVGRTAAVRLTPGALLSPAQLLDPGQAVVPAGQAVAGGLLPAGSAPIAVREGDQVQLVLRGAQGTSGGPQVIPGWVLDVGEVQPGGDRPVSVVVAADQAQVVSAAAADDRMSLVVQGVG